MKPPIPSSIPARTTTRHGFALVAVMMLIAMLTLVVVAMLSMFNIDTGTATLDSARVQARANARFALEQAIAELQRQAGPDQRVTASAALLDRDPSTPAIEGVAQPHWTGVWRTTDPGDEAPMIQRVGNEAGIIDGSLRDRRNHHTPEHWRQQLLTGWLVSGNEHLHPGDPGHVTPLADDPQLSTLPLVTLVGADRDREGRPVKVPLVQLDHLETDPRRQRRHAYAWWVGDEGVKARLDTPDPRPRTATGDPAVHGGDLHRLTAAGRPAADWMSDGGLRIGEDVLDRLWTREQLELADTDAAVSRWFHDTTLHSWGVLADTSHGGLRRNLTAYLESDGELPPLAGGSGPHTLGLSDSDLLVGPANADHAERLGVEWEFTRHREAAPRFGQLRSWARLAEQHDRRVAPWTMRPRGPLQYDTGLPPEHLPPGWGQHPSIQTLGQHVHTVYNSSCVSIPDFHNQSETTIYPVLVEGSVYYAFRARQLANNRWTIDVHILPRVVLWNPYNVTFDARRYNVWMQIVPWQPMTVFDNNGDRTDIEFILPNISHPASARAKNPTTGFLIFNLEPEPIGPGECVVYSCAHQGTQPYDRIQVSANRLSSRVAPGNNAFLLETAFPTGLEFSSRPLRFRFGATIGEDYRMLMKTVPDNTPDFDLNAAKAFPADRVIWPSTRAGANRNTHPTWPVITLGAIADPGQPLPPPDYRTRDGYRLVYLNETQTNRNRAPHGRMFEHAHVANANLHGSLFIRTPFEDLDLARLPEYYGTYTRDLWDPSLSWDAMSPRQLPSGRLGSNPYAIPEQWMLDAYLLFDLPRAPQDLLSLAEFQHAKLSEFVWHPSYAIGNSFADPRSPAAATNHPWGGFGGFHGWNGGMMSNNYWAWLIQGAIRHCHEQIIVYDLSYELNHTLYDGFLLAGGSPAQRDAHALDPVANPLPNPRLRLHPFRHPAPVSADRAALDHLHLSAAALMLEGAFNINSTSVDAWTAVLGSSRGTDLRNGDHDRDVARFQRFLVPPGDRHNDGGATAASMWNGYRSLDQHQVRHLAEAVVEQVKRRGPFISLADFVNRRLSDHPDDSRMGPLQAAIEAAGLNADGPAIDLNPLAADNTPAPNNRFRTRHSAKPDQKTAALPGSLTQADVLTAIGPQLAARSDTFTVRSYGEVRDGDDRLLARAWLEAVVQRVPEPVEPDSAGLNPATTSAGNPGRRFVIVETRWLGEAEL